jgi:hypothetical protein
MTPTELVACCWDYAAECWFFAQRQDNAGYRLALIDMAQSWLALADRVEKNKTQFAPYRAPDSKWFH